MRTVPITGEAELGYVLAVHVTANPGQVDPDFEYSKTVDLTLKTSNIEIDRYNIDSTNGNSNEQYIPHSELPKPMFNTDK